MERYSKICRVGVKHKEKTMSEELTQDAGVVTNDSQENKESSQVEQKAEKSFTRDEVNKMIATEKKKAIAEYERLAKMTEAERTKERMAQKIRERDKERADFEAEKKAFEIEKMKMQTSKELINRKLPAEFASFLVTDNAESTKQNLDNFEKMFRSSIESAVADKIRGKNPPMTSTTKVDDKPSTLKSKAWNKNK